MARPTSLDHATLHPGVPTVTAQGILVEGAFPPLIRPLCAFPHPGLPLPTAVVIHSYTSENAFSHPGEWHTPWGIMHSSATEIHSPKAVNGQSHPGEWSFPPRKWAIRPRIMGTPTQEMSHPHPEMLTSTPDHARPQGYQSPPRAGTRHAPTPDHARPQGYQSPPQAGT